VTRNKLASLLCKLEGKKSSVSIGNCREILKCLVALVSAEMMMGSIQNPPSLDCLYQDALHNTEKMLVKGMKVTRK
jgi:hypothetical protein